MVVTFTSLPSKMILSGRWISISKIVTGFGLRVSDYGLPDAGEELPVSSFGLPISDIKLPVFGLSFLVEGSVKERAVGAGNLFLILSANLFGTTLASSSTGNSSKHFSSSYPSLNSALT